MNRRDLRRVRRQRRRVGRRSGVHARRRVGATLVLAAAASLGLALGLRAAAPPAPAPSQVATPAPTEPARRAAAGPSGTAAADPVPEQRPGGPEAYSGNGELAVVPGTSAASGAGSVNRFVVEVERGLDVDRVAFAAEVERTLFDDRSWGADGALAFQRVKSGEADFRVTLASPDKTDELCAPHLTEGIYSCHQDGRAVLNVFRWQEGARTYGKDLAGYRRYLVNHEVGHAIGHSAHLSCPAAGEPAPLMMQQTIEVEPCEPNPWPTDLDREGVP